MALSRYLLESGTPDGYLNENGSGVLLLEAIPTAVLTGTITASVTEANIVSGGRTLIITLTDDEWIAAGPASFDLQRDEILAGVTSAQSETLGWNLVPRALQSLSGIVRTSATVVTITWDAFATYDITANETITVTVPATAVLSGVSTVATPTFGVAKVSAAYTLIVEGASYSFTPQAAGTRAQRKLVVTGPAYSFTTASAGLKATRKLTVTPATYSFITANAGIFKGFKIVVTPATYALTLASAGLTAQRKLVCDPATYAFTTSSAGITAQRKLNVSPATYSFTTQSANLLAQRRLSVTGPVYSFATENAILKALRKLNVTGATYNFTTQDAGILAQRKLGVTGATYSFITANAGLFKGFKIVVTGATYNFTTASAALIALRRLSVTGASYTLNTPNGNLLFGRKLGTTNAVYAFNAADADLIYTPSGGNRIFSVDGAVYQLVMPSVNLKVGRRISVSPAIYSVTTQDARLLYGRKLGAGNVVYNFNAADADFRRFKFQVDGPAYQMVMPSVTLRTARRLSVSPCIYQFITQDTRLYGRLFERPSRVRLTHDRDSDITDLSVTRKIRLKHERISVIV